MSLEFDGNGWFEIANQSHLYRWIKTRHSVTLRCENNTRELEMRYQKIKDYLERVCVLLHYAILQLPHDYR